MTDETVQERTAGVPPETTTLSQAEEGQHAQEPKQPTGLEATEENRSLIERLIEGVKKL